MNRKGPAPPGQPLSIFKLSDIPDNDPGWLTVRDFIDIGVRRLKSLELAIADTRCGYARGDVPAMTRLSKARGKIPLVHRHSPEEAALLSEHISWHQTYFGDQVFADSVLYLHVTGAEIIWPTGGYRLVPTDPAIPAEVPALSTSLPVTSEVLPKRPGPEGKSAEHEFALAYWRAHPKLLQPGARWSTPTLKALEDAEHVVSLPALKRWRIAAQKDSGSSN
jgi:hypothetical protein